MQRNSTRVRDGERGAALITMLLVATLLLAAGGALIISTATSATNAIDATTEKQAYYAAEAGIQMALNVLRGNMQPDGAVAAGTVMGFRAAISPDLSNGAGRSGGVTTVCATDTPNVNVADATRCRLAGWLPYAGDKASATALVPVGLGTAFRVSVFDPDNSQNVTFSTSGRFTAQAGLPILAQVQNGGSTLLLGTAPDQIKIEYLGRTTTTLTNALPSANTDFGSFRVTKLGLGVALPTGTLLGNFVLTVNQTGPWSATTTFNSTMITPAAASCPAELFHFLFERTTQQADGTSYTQTGLDASRQFIIPCAMGASSVTAAVSGTVTAPQPKKLIIRSVGFGPKWSQKRLELLVTRSNFAGEFPAAVTLRGASDCTPPVIDTGSSGAKTYTGVDRDGVDPQRPAFAVSACDVDNMESGISKHDTVSDPEIGVLDNGTPPGGVTTTTPTQPVAMPSYLSTPEAARAYVNDLQAQAQAQGTYYKPAAGTALTVDDTYGSAAQPGFTFVDGDCDLATVAGGGLLVVTGNLNMGGNPTFDGVVLVLGAGSVNRDGGGQGTISGAFVVASFRRTWLPSEDDPAIDNNTEFPFLAPTFLTNGGGDSTVQPSSTAINNAMNLLGAAKVGGVLEY